MSKKKQLTENELKKVQSMLNAFNQLKMKLGDIELSKNEVMDSVSILKKDYVIVEKELAEKYGENSQIDIKTGAVTDKIKEEKLEKV
jgi:hypothetical protein|tara:strand:- start:413 stop:673 length:261 start_codon:yes stop_codon:yes gene_type:complete